MSTRNLPPGVTSEAGELWRLFSLILLLLAIGTIGYSVLERWSVIDSLYMTIITLSTVGYGEVAPLSQAGKVFTGLLIISGVGMIAYSLTFITRAIIEGEITRITGLQKMQKRIFTLVNHTIVCGYGRLGRIVVQELLGLAEHVVVVDKNPDVIQELADDGLLHVHGLAYDDETLRSAKIDQAKNFIALLPSDAENVYSILCARDLNSTLNIVTRSEGEPGEKRLLRAGANKVVAPYRVSGARIVQRLIRPHVSDFLEIANNKGGAQLALEEVVVPLGSPLAGKTVEESKLRDKTGLIIAALIDEQGNIMANPDRSSVIESGVTMILLGQRQSLDKLTELLYAN